MNLPPLPILPPLPVLPKLAAQAPLPFEPIYSPWFPLARDPWEAGHYQIKLDDGTIMHGGLFMREPDETKPALYLWDGLTWADRLPLNAVAWRGLAHPPEVK